MPAPSDPRTASGGPRPDAPGTLNQLFLSSLDAYPKPDTLLGKIEGTYLPISHATLRARARYVARGLQAIGLRPGERVGILSENCPEWAIVDYGTLGAALPNVPVYPTLPPAQAAAILRHAGVAALFTSDTAQMEKVVQIRSAVPTLRRVIAMGGEAGAGADLTLAELERLGAAGETEASVCAYEQEALAIRPESLATILYTSGTTGEPKGVMLSHDNVCANVRAILARLPYRDGGDVALSLLPLSHSLERTVGHYCALATGTTVAYATSFETIAEDLLAVRPTVVLAVPRFYEKIYDRVLAGLRRRRPPARALFSRALDAADRWASAHVDGREPGRLLALSHAVSQRLLCSRFDARTGGRLRFLLCGGAPLAPDVVKFFLALGRPILEGYGLTETSPVITASTPDAFRPGAVGRPLPGVEVRIAHDGEILTRGPHVMMGYHDMPAAARQTIDAEGWLHTGDLGRLDDDGFLSIVGRKKDLLITAGGKNVVPGPIEAAIERSRFVSRAVLVGDGRRYLVAFVVPSFPELEDWARRQRLSFASRRELVEHPRVAAKMEHEVRTAVADRARFEIPKKVGLLARELSLAEGELTPTLKVRRAVIESRYASLLERLYADPDSGASERSD